MDQAELAPLTTTQKRLIKLVVTGGILIAAIGFTGSYAAVSHLAEQKHFGWFATVFPIGVDAGIAVMLALDLVLTGCRMPFPLLRQAAWFLTAATIAFNAAAQWGDWLAVGMHATIPTLFIVVMEAARHAVGRIARIHAGAYYENPPLPRWILAPWPTYRIWRRMRLWNIRSYGDVIEMERDAKVLRATLKARHGWRWRRTATQQETLALRLARLGTPVAVTLSAPMAPLGAPVERPQSALDGATDDLQPVYLERPESATEAPVVASPVAPRAAIESATEAPQTPATKRPESATGSATQSAGVDLTKRHQSATQPAIEAPAKAPRKRPTPAAEGATDTPRKAPSKRPEGTPRERAADAIKALYTDLGRRPLESEMVAALKKAKLPHSRQFANARRLEIEKADPALAALGSDNVRALTGTDN